jgi:peptide/nickel transport system substrate-binding protein
MSEDEKLVKLLNQGKISRRDFIAKAAALGLAATISPTMLSGVAKAAGPKRGGRLRLGLAGGATTDSLDPATITDLMMQVINQGQIRNTLVEIDNNSQPVPELAESWDASADAKTWTFKLRKGVEFHNGKTMDADDVIYSINHHRGKDTKSAAKGIIQQIKDIKKDGSGTVIFELAGGNADFPYIMSDYHLTISPAGSDFKKGIGTGGYVLKEYEPGVRAFVVRNKNYFKSNRAHFDEVETLGIADVNARTNALKTGQIDAMNRCELKTVHFLKRDKKLQILTQKGTKHYTFAMRCDTAPYDNNDVRMAMKYGIDREQMVKTILRGHGSMGNDHPISTANRYHASELEQRRYDPDKAMYHLKKAGAQGMTFKLHASDAAFGGAVDAAVLYQNSAKKAGFKIEVVREPKDGYWSNVWLKKPWCAVFWGGRPTEDMMFSTAYAAGASWNDTFWNNKKFNELLVAARAELDEKKRREMYVEMQSLVRDDGGVVIPMFAEDLGAATAKIGHEKLGVNWEMDGFRCAERWWFK